MFPNYNFFVLLLLLLLLLLLMITYDGILLLNYIIHLCVFSIHYT
jgi:hypothetical protein